jgi:hypothetical protein
LRASKKEVQAPSTTELAMFRKWFLEFDAEAWDRQIERDSVSGRLENFAKKSLKDHDNGQSAEL